MSPAARGDVTRNRMVKRTIRSEGSLSHLVRNADFPNIWKVLQRTELRHSTAGQSLFPANKKQLIITNVDVSRSSQTGVQYARDNRHLCAHCGMLHARSDAYAAGPRRSACFVHHLRRRIAARSSVWERLDRRDPRAYVSRRPVRLDRLRAGARGAWLP